MRQPIEQVVVSCSSPAKRLGSPIEQHLDVRTPARVHHRSLAGPRNRRATTSRNTQFEVIIPPEYRAPFTRTSRPATSFAASCVTPRAVQDRKAVVQAPRDLKVTAEPSPALPPLPTGVYRTCQGDIEMPEPNDEAPQLHQRGHARGDSATVLITRSLRAPCREVRRACSRPATRFDA